MRKNHGHAPSGPLIQSPGQPESGQDDAAVATIDRALSVDQRSRLRGRLKQLREWFLKETPYRVPPLRRR